MSEMMNAFACLPCNFTVLLHRKCKKMLQVFEVNNLFDKIFGWLFLHWHQTTSTSTYLWNPHVLIKGILYKYLYCRYLLLKLLLKLTKSNHSVDYVMHVPVNRTALPNIDRLSMFYAKCERIALQPAAWRRCGRGVFSIPSVAALNIHEAPSIFMKTPSPSLLRFKIFFNTPAAPAAATSTSRDIVNQWRPPPRAARATTVGS